MNYKYQFRGFLVTLFCIWVSVGFAQIKICSWNIQDMGKSKTDEQIMYMADLLKGFDVIALQEVVAGPGGAQSVAKLADELNRKGTKWEYTTSIPTKSSPYTSERYAFLWKTSRLKVVGKAWLDSYYQNEIEREPYLIQLKHKNEVFTLVNFHALPKKKQPEREIKYFKHFPSLYPNNRLVFLGDFNVPETHSVFNPLKKINYISVLKNQKTTLKTTCRQNNCLSSAYDHIFLNSTTFQILDFGALHFYTDFTNLKEARKISDHIPIWVEVGF